MDLALIIAIIALVLSSLSLGLEVWAWRQERRRRHSIEDVFNTFSRITCNGPDTSRR